MGKSLILLMTVVAVLLSGCMSFKMGENDGRRCRYVVQDNLMQCTAERLTSMVPKIEKYYENIYKITLVAHGSFTVHRGRQVVTEDIGSPMLAVGFFPGACRGKDNMEKVGLSVGAPLMNVITLAIPTIISLFIEPFRDYWDLRTESDGEKVVYLDGTYRIDYFGLIGCSKYYNLDDIRFSEKTFETHSCHRSNSIQLYGYKVSINGTEREDYQGALYYKGHPGERLKIRIISAPSLRKESKEKFTDQDFSEIEFDVVCP